MSNMVKPSSRSFWTIVWKQFNKRKPAVISLWIIVLFFALAIFAPFLANDKPIWIYGTYEELYRQQYMSFSRNHEIYVDSVVRLEELLKEKKSLETRSDKLKKEYKELIVNYDNSVNLYNSLREKSEAIDLDITRLREKLKAKADGDMNESTIQKEIASVQKQKLSVEKKRKEEGIRQFTLKKKMVKEQASQSQLNTRLHQVKNLLDWDKRQKYIRKSLSAMGFHLDDLGQGQLDKALAGYDKLFSRYEKALKQATLMKEKVAEFMRHAGDNYHFVSQALNPTAVRKHLEKRLILPILDSLDLLDIVFIAIVLAFALLPLVNKYIVSRYHHPQQKRTARWLGYAVVMVVLTCIIALSRGESIPTDYKAMMTPDSDRVAMFPPVAFGFNENILEEKYQKPNLFGGRDQGRHVFGTDETGRDVFSRMIWGSRISLSVGFVAVSIYVFIGILVGAMAGYFGGWVDILISRFIEIVICFPAFFLILTIIAFVGPSIYNIMIIIGLTSWTGVARLVRGEFLKLRTHEYVMAAKSMGAANSAIIFRHILPNALTPVLVAATFGIASAMLTEASLSFLGFGVRDPYPSWGQMISAGRSDVLNYSWLSLIPGIAIFISVTTYNLVGDSLRESIDPRLRE